MRRVVAFLSVALLTGGLALAQATPIVKLSLTLPDGQVKEMSVLESGTGTVTLADGTEIGVRPTILDSKPWSQVLVTFFKMPTANRGVEQMGAVEVKTGGGAVQSRTNPGFKVAVTAVSEGSSST